MDSAELELDNAFWRFSLAVYAADGVADECLALQQEFNIDINLLLFSAWLGADRGIDLTQEDIRTADATVERWRSRVVRPLREVRQVLKQAQTNHEGFRRKVKAIELEAEQIEQAILYIHARERWPQDQQGQTRTITPNIRAYMLYATDGTARPDNKMQLKKLTDAASGLAR
ncbi:MAG TPA: TIGR02444 family protein [Pseudolabrys sp.]|jgi:uncharacterized protein (TIGR02444 family)|nr:TIGR02444 family protein [Pseudolabrys sp.]